MVSHRLLALNGILKGFCNKNLYIQPLFHFHITLLKSNLLQSRSIQVWTWNLYNGESHWACKCSIQSCRTLGPEAHVKDSEPQTPVSTSPVSAWLRRGRTGRQFGRLMLAMTSDQASSALQTLYDWMTSQWSTDHHPLSQSPPIKTLTVWLRMFCYYTSLMPSYHHSQQAPLGI